MSRPRPVLEVQGARRLRATLRRAGDDLENLKTAHAEAAKIAAQASAALAPTRSGRLRNTIRSAGTKVAGIIRAGYKAIPYAGPIHWGWRTRPNRMKGWRGGPVAAQPFLSDGAKDSEGRWLRIYESHLESAVQQVKGIS